MSATRTDAVLPALHRLASNLWQCLWCGRLVEAHLVDENRHWHRC